jgi:bifunctional UDP-N-acetylglucosamine pyrophosphorylase/glucosamine-1-phosphate N-acetyltransferase
MSEFAAIILAAGKGTRMKSRLPKVLHKLSGKPMLEHVLDAADEAGVDDEIVIVGFGSEKVTEFLGTRARVAIQKEQLGTGHAVLQARDLLKGEKGTAMILCGDTPLLEGSELKKFYETHKESGAGVSVLTADAPNPFGYGRILRDTVGRVTGIVEEKDATEEQRRIHEINTGIYCVEMPLLFELLENLSNDNAQGEYYLTDILTECLKRGRDVCGIKTRDFDMVMGINSRRQLAEAQRVMNARIVGRLMDAGVTVMDPASTFVEKGVRVGQDTILYPFTWLEGETVIGSDCVIGPQVRFTNVTVGDATEIQFAYAHDCRVGSGVKMGPYDHLRPDTVIGDKVKIGNFVEVKNSNVGTGTKLPHLQYIGDSDVGSGVNMGCGTITVNYDGNAKHRTTIEDDAFVGCNSNLVAPVTIGRGSYVAAGSTITKNVPADSLAVARGKQVNIEGWAKKHRQK